MQQLRSVPKHSRGTVRVTEAIALHGTESRPISRAFKLHPRRVPTLSFTTIL